MILWIVERSQARNPFMHQDRLSLHVLLLPDRHTLFDTILFLLRILDRDDRRVPHKMASIRTLKF